MAAVASVSSWVYKAFHSTGIPGTPPETGISGTYFKWKATSTASKGCPSSGMLWKSLVRQTKMLWCREKREATHSFIHSFILSSNVYWRRPYCIPGIVPRNKAEKALLSWLATQTKHRQIMGRNLPSANDDKPVDCGNTQLKVKQRKTRTWS